MLHNSLSFRRKAFMRNSTCWEQHVGTVVIKSTSCECDPDIVVRVQKEAVSVWGLGGPRCGYVWKKDL